MESLKDIQSKSYTYMSRYSNFHFAYNINDDKYIYELTGQLDENSPHIVHVLCQTDTLDYLADKYYGRPDLFWVIADFNKISDPFIDITQFYKEVKVPSLTSISYKD